MRRPLLILPAAAAAVAIAGCGGYAAGTPASAPAIATHAAASAKHAVVTTRHGRLGTFLTDGRGRTLYLRVNTGSRTGCTGACAQAWPPLTTRERPEAEGGAKASLLSTVRRPDGTRQVAYRGHALYRFEPDVAPGQTGGQGVNAFGAHWYVVSPAGTAITRASGSAPSGTPSTY